MPWSPEWERFCWEGLLVEFAPPPSTLQQMIDKEDRSASFEIFLSSLFLFSLGSDFSRDSIMPNYIFSEMSSTQRRRFTLFGE
jgi:hypothetical protein